MPPVSPQVSVVIPAYNALAYLPTTLESVLNQTFQDFEVVIVDDGSSDGTPDWVAQLNDPRVKLVRQPNQGTPGARNTGVQQSQGQYIAFLDADDLWAPTKLARQVAYLDQHPEVGLVDTWTILIDQKGQKTGKVVTSDAVGQVWAELAQRNTVTCGSSPMVRRACFDQVGLFDRGLLFAEDWDMWLRISAHYAFGVIPEPLVRYRLHPSNKSKNCRGMMHDCCTILERAFAAAPPEMQALKPKSYSTIYLYLAWTALDSADWEQAIYFRDRALAELPSLRATRLNVAIAITRIMGSRFFGLPTLPVTHVLRAGIPS